MADPTVSPIPMKAAIMLDVISFSCSSTSLKKCLNNFFFYFQNLNLRGSVHAADVRNVPVTDGEERHEEDEDLVGMYEHGQWVLLGDVAEQKGNDKADAHRCEPGDKHRIVARPLDPTTENPADIVAGIEQQVVDNGQEVQVVPFAVISLIDRRHQDRDSWKLLKTKN
jgi:hypothetical protein